MTQWAQFGSVAMRGVSVLANASADAGRIYDETYNLVSENLARKFRNSMIIDAAHKNLIAAKQDQVTANTAILDAEAEAEAAAKVAAAFAGVEGGSVQAVEYNIQANAALAKESVAQRTKQEEQNLLNTVYGAAYEHASKLNLPKVSPNYKSMLDSATSIWDNGGKDAAMKLWDDVTRVKAPTSIAGDYRQHSSPYNNETWRVV